MSAEISKDATAKEILDAIDGWAAAADNARGWDTWPKEPTKLWDILSAMRGPDNGDGRLKQATTAVLRGLVLPHLAGGRADVAGGTLESVRKTVHYEASQRSDLHFLDHIQFAVNAIEKLR
jgi:hypothetical protein